MNKKQRIILFVVASVILLMLLFPPFQSNIRDLAINAGYSFIFKPPLYERHIAATVDTEMLNTQVFIILAIGVLCWFAFKNNEKK
jgi:hypothetical protein